MLNKTIIPYIIVAIIVIAGVSTAIITKKPKQKTPNTTAKIGILLPDFAGERTFHAIDMAREDFEGKEIEFVYKDAGCDAEKAKLFMREMANDDDVIAIIGEFCSGTTIELISLAEEFGIPLISPASTSAKLTGISKWFFRTIPPDDRQSTRAAQLIRDNGHDRLAIIHSNELYGQGLADAIKEKFSALGGTIVAVEPFLRDETNLEVNLLRIRTQAPDALYIISNSAGSGSALIEILSKQNLNVEYFGAESMKDPVILETLAKEQLRMTVTAPKALPEVFRQTMLDRYDLKNPGVIAGTTYDAVTVVLLGLHDGVPSRKEMMEYLKHIDFDGVSGKIRFDKDGNIPSGYYAHTSIEGSDFVELSE